MTYQEWAALTGERERADEAARLQAIARGEAPPPPSPPPTPRLSAVLAAARAEPEPEDLRPITDTADRPDEAEEPEQ